MAWPVHRHSSLDTLQLGTGMEGLSHCGRGNVIDYHASLPCAVSRAGPPPPTPPDGGPPEKRGFRDADERGLRALHHSSPPGRHQLSVLICILSPLNQIMKLSTSFLR
ncbi:hypothetical protein AAFF_G00396830 [Aldrovandia affinis]|uniref:Uncharacterized protein n=1 Tax=Aldrovandia affinis TaxID=143900 RepID=A0AAD7SCZ2_9TELE|nr:hypothetical protein AAFF_G00396830 [Aldrovandia affinis]